MQKKKRDISLPKRFNSEDVKKWQEQANLTTGGDGSNGRIFSKETRKKMSKARKGVKVTEEQKNKTRLSMLGKNCKKVINTETGEIYKSVQEAAISIGMNRTSLINRLKGKWVNNTKLKYY